MCGHADAGKSTLMGHLLYLKGHVSERQMKQLKHQSEQSGKSSFAYAWLLDAHESERARGVTVDVAVEQFETDHRIIALLDAPGHRDFIPNMIAGAAQADVAILVVDVTPSGFADGFVDGGQTKEHAILLRSMGISELIVAVNKMDLIKYDHGQYCVVVEEMSIFLKQSGFKDMGIHFIPVSGFLGVNLLSRNDTLLSWYDGPTLIEQIDRFKIPERLTGKPFRFCIADVYKSAAGGCMVAGKVESGSVIVKDKVLILPLCELAVVKSVSQKSGVCCILFS